MPIPLKVTLITPVAGTTPATDGHFGYETFLVTFDPTTNANGTASGITDFTGTYSYLVEPVASDRIRTLLNLPTTGTAFGDASAQGTVPVSVPPSGSAGRASPASTRRSRPSRWRVTRANRSRASPSI